MKAFAIDLPAIPRKPLRILILGVTFLFAAASAGSLRAQNVAGLAKQVETLFRAKCYECHGDAGNAEAEFYVLNYQSLVPKRVVSAKPDESLLFRKIRSGDMPPDEPLDAASQILIKQWIAVGAPDFNPPRAARKFITPADMVQAIATDLNDIKQQNPDDLPFARYFTHTHLYNARLDDDQLATYQHALSKLINSLSWGRKIVPPRPIDKEKTIFHIDLRNYKWNEATWNAIHAANPYGVKLDTTYGKYCSQVTLCELPFARGDWFVSAASRPPLYHTVLGLPDTDKKLEERLNIDVAENLRTKRVARAGFNGSGVSQHNRLVERHESDLTNGAYWKSYDFAGSEDKKNLFAHPLGPAGVQGGSNAFEHDGGELIFNLPNGLQAYLLVDKNGKRIDKGPINVVSDPVQKDRAVVNGVSCMSCHVKGMIKKQDEVRPAVEANRGSFDSAELNTIFALYPAAAKFEALQDEDEKRFADAVKLTGAPLASKDPIVLLSLRFEAELGVELAAAELGLTVEEFQTGLGKSAELSRTLGPLQVKGGRVKREVFVKTFGAVVEDLGLGEFLPRIVSEAPVAPTVTNPTPTRPVPAVNSYTGTQPGQMREDNGLKIKFCWCPLGNFTMGSPNSETDRDDDENQVPVTLTKGFWLGKHEVTQSQWQSIMGTTLDQQRVKAEGSKAYGVGASHPMYYVSHEEATEFCVKLTAQERQAGRLPAGWEYRLPTESQWEYACRAGKSGTYSFGNSATNLGDYAWYDENSGSETHPVGQKKPNDFGLCDMHGNVWEWCRDWYQAELPGGTDPEVSQQDADRVIRGGSWRDITAYCGSALRGSRTPSYRFSYVGFRMAAVQHGAK